MLDTFRKIFYLVGRERPGRWVVLVVGAVVVSALEMLGTLLVFVLLALIADPTGELAVPLLGDLRAYFGEVDEATFLLGAAGVMGAFFLIRLVVQVTYTYVKQRLAHNAAARLSARLAEGYLRLPYAFHLRRSSSELVRNSYQNLENLAHQGFLAAILVVAELILVVGLAVVMLVVAPLATIVAVLIVGSAALLLLRVVQPRLQQLGLKAQESRKRALGSLQQSLHGIRDIKVLRSEDHFGRVYRGDREELSHSLYLRGTVLELPRLVIETALIAFILLLFAFSIVTGTATHELLSTLGLFAYAGLRIQPSLQKFVSGLNSVRYSSAAVDEVFEDLKLIEQIESPSDDVGELTFERELHLDGVSFTYESGHRPAVEDVDLRIESGELIGICGPSGGGKTTLTDLITGILEPTGGVVTVDGVDLTERRAAWFRKLGVVPQMIFLVDDTLRRNIALGTGDDAIDEAAVREAVELAQLEEFVGSLPDGLDTVVGERGVRLSGGQRQRVAIARALYRRPEVLVFDEGTSALDNTTESVLISSLEHLRGTRTIILVAHRLSTVRDCDRIVYVEDGRVAGVGEFSELQAENAGFRALAEYSG